MKRLYERGERGRLSADQVKRIETVLAALDVAEGPNDLDRPAFRLHPLTGNRKGQWAVTVRANWRIVFRFGDGHIHDVDLVDYH
ncbi:MAG: type II toxin-antitoxin system RelE/ParE family toxin [Inquilinaceae bacterium]